MNIKNLMKHIKVTGGATLNNQLNIADISNGYMVSIKGYETVVENIDENIGSIERHINEYSKMISDKNNMYIGLWYNEEKLYIDISKNIENIEDALLIGSENEQLAIYDVAKDNVINVA